ncbi:hypothetical protein RB195_023669 [Necator americanus]|uniref:Uncharacterized protein n=1 Tax=Necator americanus TaxID=51031 RepID=A0ABR1EKM8_NECAM
MPTLKLQLNYDLSKNIPFSNIRKSRAVWDVAFDSDNRPILLSFMVRFQKRYRSSTLTEARLGRSEKRVMQKEVPPRVSISIELWTKERADDADSFFKRIQEAEKKTPPVLTPRKKFAFASAETISTKNSVCVACITSEVTQEKLRRRLRHQLKRDRENEWTS